ncbi:MAG TPA: AIR synthase-related protein, partial [Salinivirgaceae bacterium]|nr:AIR synthase-related protein [Salinivirgaceae bacterium]
GEVIKTIIEGTQEFIELMSTHGIECKLTGGETADIGDLVRTIVVDSTVTARLHRSKVIDNRNISDGDVIIGLASSGKTTYETEYNSGIGSNGLTSARHDVFHHSLTEKYPESFDPSIPDNLVYSGKYHITDIVSSEYPNIGKLVLSPTRTYAPVVKAILEEISSEIHGMIHCSGGAQTKVMKFVENMHVVKDNLFPIPILFSIIKQESQASWEEMYKVFNMGHRFEIYCKPAYADIIIDIARKFNLDAQIIGYCQEADQNKLTIKTEFCSIEY